MNHYFFRNRILVALGLALSTAAVALKPMEAEEDAPSYEIQHKPYNIDAGKSLIDATKHDSLSIVKTALRSGAYPNFYDDNDDSRSTALHMAAFDGKLQIMEALIKAGADVNIRNSKGETPLHKATLTRKTDAVQLLIHLGAKINVASNTGNMPLHFAVTAQTSELAEMLIKAGADINTRTNEIAFISPCTGSFKDFVVSKWTPLHYAAARGNSCDVIQFLLEKGAKRDITDCYDRTALNILLQRLNAVKLLDMSRKDSQKLKDNVEQMIHVLQGEQPLPEHLGVTTVSIDPYPQLTPQISVIQRVIGWLFGDIGTLNKY